MNFAKRRRLISPHLLNMGAARTAGRQNCYKLSNHAEIRRAMSTSRTATILKSGVCRTNVRHRPAPSLFYFPGLNTQPMWKVSDHISLKQADDALRSNYQSILNEYVQLRQSNLSSDFDTSRDEHKLHEGKWEWNSYVLKGKRQGQIAIQCPQTVDVLESLSAPSLMTQTPFGFAFFSTLSPGTIIAPHTGPCNLRIRCHLPLIVPTGDCGMRIADNSFSWKIGEPIFFDDSYEHEVWNRSDHERVMLLFDMWHPDLHKDEIAAIIEMFQHATAQGWLK